MQTFDPTLEQASDFFRLLTEAGIVDAMQAAEAQRRGPKKGDRVDAAGNVIDRDGDVVEQQTGPIQVEDETVRIEASHILRMVDEHDLLIELGSIVFDTSREEARTIRASTFEEGFVSFASACLSLPRTIVDYSLVSG